MQIGQQIVNLLIAEHVAETLHLVASHANDVFDSVVIGRHAAGRKVVSLKQSPQAGSLALPRGIGRVTAVAIFIVDVPPRRLSRCQSKFGIAFAALNVASAAQYEQKREYAGDYRDFPPLDIKKLEFQRKNLNHSRDICRHNQLYRITNHSRSSQYWHGLCWIFTHQNSILSGLRNFEMGKNPRKNPTFLPLFRLQGE